MHFLLFSNDNYLPLLEIHKSFFMQCKHVYLKLHGLVPEPGQPQVECLLCSRELMFQHQRSTEALLTQRKNCMLQRKRSYVVLAAQNCLQSFEPRMYPFEELHVTA